MSVVSEPTEKHHEDASTGLHLLVAMPALNEEATIVRVIEAIPRDIEGIGRLDVLVVNDGSTDRTGSRRTGARCRRGRGGGRRIGAGLRR